MTTYRQRLVWLVDGEYTTRNRGKSQSVNRTLDRRIKRRQHHSITKEAVDSWYADAADDRFEWLAQELADEMDWAYGYDGADNWDDYLHEPEEEYEHYDPYEDYIDDGWASYHYDETYDLWGGTPVTPEDKRFIEREDVGKSLGEILEEIQQKQRR